ncbi:MAG: SDR family oxidoreductase [Proteobacteria bacterium]|nr:SDR family oxidoreductase [Pseudomonadota bacterium]
MQCGRSTIFNPFHGLAAVLCGGPYAALSHEHNPEEEMMTGKRGLVFGMANKNSIAFGVVQAMLAEGIEVMCVTAPGLQGMAEKALDGSGVMHPVLTCDVAGSSDGIITLAAKVKEIWPDGFDYLVHAIAFSDKTELEGSILSTTRENFLKTMDISAYSLVPMCCYLCPQMREGGAVAAFTFAGSRFRSPNYNVMGVAKAGLEALVRYLAPAVADMGLRINAISAGPVRTLSSRGVSDFALSLKMGETRSVTGKNVSAEEVGVATLKIMQAPGITGYTIDVDNGIALAGMGSSEREMEIYRAHVATSA